MTDEPLTPVPSNASPSDASADALATLARLRAAAPGAEPVVLESLGPPDESAPDSALDFLFRRLSTRFHEVVAVVREEWGTPQFYGSVEEGAFPAWSDALLLATWWEEDKVAYLAVHHDDEADPLELRAGALDQAEVEERLTWKPPEVER